MRNITVDTTRPPWCDATPKVEDAGQVLPSGLLRASSWPRCSRCLSPHVHVSGPRGHVSGARATVQRLGNVSEHCAHAGPRDRVCAGEMRAMARAATMCAGSAAAASTAAGTAAAAAAASSAAAAGENWPRTIGEGAHSLGVRGASIV